MELDAKSRQCIFLRYHKGIKGFKLYDPMANKVVISGDVIFDEKAMLQNTQKEEKQALKNHDSHESVVQVELETRRASTHNAKDGTHNARRASIKRSAAL